MQELSIKRGWLWAGVVALLFFACALPTLRWQQFSSGSENLVVATTLEIKRGGPWWTPTLKEKPRLAKPPLTAWIAAAGVSDETVKQLDAADSARREEGYRDLAFQIRWPALLASALTLLAAFEFGRIFLGPNTALASVMLLATTLMFTRFGRSATTDVQLMLWVAWSNVFLLHALLKGRRWLLVAAGGTLGLAFMSKGPVGFVQSLLPALAAWWWMGRGRGDTADGTERLASEPANPIVVTRGRPLIAPALVGLVVFAGIAFPWYVSQLFKDGELDRAVWTRWRQEVTREGATNLEPDPFYNYVSIVWTMAPWFVFFLGGLLAAFTEMKKPWGRRLFAAGFFVGIPIVIMSCVKDKPERYLLPLGPAAALLAAHSLMTMYRDAAGSRDRLLRRIGLSIPWLALAAFGVLGFTPWGQEQLPKGIGVGPTLVAGAGLIAFGIAVVVTSRLTRWGPILCSVGIMMLVGTLGLAVYTHTPPGQSGYKPVAEFIRREYPNRPVFAPPKEKEPVTNDLNIYLNRVVKEIPIEEIAPADAVLVLIQKEKMGEPTPPPGWKKEHTLSAEKRVLAICVRE